MGGRELFGQEKAAAQATARMFDSSDLDRVPLHRGSHTARAELHGLFFYAAQNTSRVTVGRESTGRAQFDLGGVR